MLCRPACAPFNDSKRLSDAPVAYSATIFAVGATQYNPNRRIREQEAGFMETWDVALNPAP